MKREVWRKLGRGLLTRVAVIVILLFVLLVLKMLAGTQTPRAKPRKPAIDHRHDPPVPPGFDRNLTRAS